MNNGWQSSAAHGVRSAGGASSPLCVLLWQVSLTARPNFLCNRDLSRHVYKIKARGKSEGYAACHVSLKSWKRNQMQMICTSLGSEVILTLNFNLSIENAQQIPLYTIGIHTQFPWWTTGEQCKGETKYTLWLIVEPYLRGISNFSQVHLTPTGAVGSNWDLDWCVWDHFSVHDRI